MRFKFNKQNVLILLSLLIFAAASIIRFCWLNADPPLFFTGLGQALQTDPYNITYFARNFALFGDSDIFDYPRLIVFKYSLMSLFSYIFFAIGGVSRFTANLAAAVISLGSIFIYTRALQTQIGKYCLIAALLLTANTIMIVYGKLPFLENGLIFLCAVLYFVVFKYSGQLSGLIITGVLITLCGLSGKMFGLMMIFPVCAALFFMSKKTATKKIVVVVASSFVSFLILAFSFYGTRIDAVFQFLGEQTAGVYGIPVGLTSPVKFLEQLTTFTGNTKLFYFSPMLLVLLIIALFIVINSPRLREKIRSNLPLLFNLVWLVSGFLLLSVFTYRPLRYHLFLVFPMAGVISIVMSEDGLKSLNPRIRIVNSLLTLVVVWYLAVQAAFIGYLAFLKKYPPDEISWYALFPALIVSLLVMIYKKYLNGIVRCRMEILIICGVLYVAHQGFLIYKWHDTISYTMHQAGNDLKGILSDNCRLSGSYAQALSIDNAIRSVTFIPGPLGEDKNRVCDWDITHLAIEEGNVKSILKYIPQLAGSRRVAEYYLKDSKVGIYRIKCRTGRDYAMTDFERAVDHMTSPRYPDSIYYYLTRFLEHYPESKAGLRLLADYYFMTQNIDKIIPTFNRLFDFYPNDFWLYFECGRTCYMLARVTGNPGMSYSAERYFDLAREKNPTMDKIITVARKRIDSMIR